MPSRSDRWENTTTPPGGTPSSLEKLPGAPDTGFSHVGRKEDGSSSYNCAALRFGGRRALTSEGVGDLVEEIVDAGILRGGAVIGDVVITEFSADGVPARAVEFESHA